MIVLNELEKAPYRIQNEYTPPTVVPVGQDSSVRKVIMSIWEIRVFSDFNVRDHAACTSNRKD